MVCSSARCTETHISRLLLFHRHTSGLANNRAPALNSSLCSRVYSKERRKQCQGSFPLNCPRRLACHVINNSVNRSNLVAYPGGHRPQECRLKRVPICCHAIRAGHSPQCYHMTVSSLIALDTYRPAVVMSKLDAYSKSCEQCQHVLQIT